jgi:hypothetical protein
MKQLLSTMEKGVTILQDSLGNTIHLRPEIFTDQPELQLSSEQVIQRPALLIETTEGSFIRRHYIRSVQWEGLVLISVELRGTIWEAFDLSYNPSSEIVNELLKKGKQLI